MQVIRQIRIHNESSNFCSLDPTDVQLLSSSSVNVWHFCHHLTVDPHSLWAAQDGGPTMESCICGALTSSFLTAPPAPNLTPTMIHSLHSSLHDLSREICHIYIYIHTHIWMGQAHSVIKAPALAGPSPWKAPPSAQNSDSLLLIQASLES